MTKPNIFQQITDRIVAQLEAGVRPWSKPWTSAQVSGGLPVNAEGRPYRGANVFNLWMEAAEKGYNSPIWLTFNKAKELGGSVRKGEKGAQVFFWLFEKKADPETGEMKDRVTYRVYTVFNLDQTDEVKLPKKMQIAVEPKADPERIADAEAVIKATGATVRYGGCSAHYVPSQDFVAMPVAADFNSIDDYYSTHFHELGHWTGHATRLDRKFGKRFGDDTYAAEELVAELTAAFICATVGIASVERDDHAAYIGHWLKVLKDDPRAFSEAASKAQKAADFILNVGRAEAEPEPEVIESDEPFAAFQRAA